MYCKKCGAQLDDNALFCSNCGEKSLADINITEQSAPVKKKTYGGEKILRFINIVAIIFTMFIGVINLFVSNIVGGIIMLLTAILLIIFVFRKKQITKIKDKLANFKAHKLIIVVVYLLLPIVMFTSVGIGASLGDSSSSSANPDTIAVSYAESVLKGRLKNSDSLQIHSSKIYVDFEHGDYHYYSITIDYSAQNGFGGYNRDNDYDVLVKVSKTTNKASEATTEEYLDAITKYNNNK